MFDFFKLSIDSIEPKLNAVKPTLNAVKPTFKTVKPALNPIEPSVDSIQSAIDLVKPSIERIQPAIHRLESSLDPGAKQGELALDHTLEVEGDAGFGLLEGHGHGARVGIGKIAGFEELENFEGIYHGPT